MTYFDNVIGQDTIKNHLTELVKRQTLPHSLLFYGEAGLGKLDMAIGLASLILGRHVFPGHNGAEYLEAVKNARLANGESEKKIEAEGLPIYMDKGDAFWIRPMKSTLKVEQWYSLLQDHLSVAGLGNRVVIIEDFHMANAIMANNHRHRCTSSLLRTRLILCCQQLFHDVWVWAFNPFRMKVFATHCSNVVLQET